MSPTAMRRYVFERVQRRFTKSVKCSGCGKRVARSTTLEQTINPFNKLPDGTPKSRRDILMELEASGREWQAEPERCVACRRSQP